MFISRTSHPFSIPLEQSPRCGSGRSPWHQPRPMRIYCVAQICSAPLTLLASTISAVPACSHLCTPAQWPLYVSFLALRSVVSCQLHVNVNRLSSHCRSLEGMTDSQCRPWSYIRQRAIIFPHYSQPYHCRYHLHSQNRMLALSMSLFSRAVCWVCPL